MAIVNNPANSEMLPLRQQNIVEKAENPAQRIRIPAVVRAMNYGSNAGNSYGKVAASAIDAMNYKAGGNSSALSNLKNAMSIKVPELARSTATTKQELFRDYINAKTVQKKTAAVELEQEQKAAVPVKSKAVGTAASMGVSSSGGKATYNVKSFSASKAGADYVNKNSPFAGYSITSYTGARNTGIKGASSYHAGIDRAVPEGTRVSVPINTTFYKSGSDNARGNWIELKDQNGNILHYQHLQSFATGLNPGDKISAGTAFAVSGHTGVGRAHLHEEYYTPDGSVNITESYWNKYAPAR